MSKKTKDACLNELTNVSTKKQNNEETVTTCVYCGNQAEDGILCNSCTEMASLDNGEDFFDQDWCIDALIERDNQISSLKKQINELASRLSKYEKVELEARINPIVSYQTLKKRTN